MTFRLEPRAYDDADVVRMIDAVQSEYVQMYGGPDEAAVDATEFVPPDGLLLVGLWDEVAVATGGWRRLDGTLAEVKRLYVDPGMRGRGLSRLVLSEIERTAVATGIDRLVLNTGPRQRPAIALYESCGYASVAGFGHYLQFGQALFYGKELLGDLRHR